MPCVTHFLPAGIFQGQNPYHDNAFKFFTYIFTQKFNTLSNILDIYNKKHYIMDIQKYIYNKTRVILPITGSGNGSSKDQPVIMTAEAKHIFIGVQNEFISAMLDDGYWKKVEQSLIQSDDGKKYDKITIRHFLVDGAEVKRVFWFDITECLGI
jgi:hypothetical protein